MPNRKPRKRGGSATKRGISNEQVCVLVARDRNKTTLSKRVGSGRIRMEQIDTTLTSHFKIGAVIYSCDSKGSDLIGLGIGKEKRESFPSRL